VLERAYAVSGPPLEQARAGAAASAMIVVYLLNSCNLILCGPRMEKHCDDIPNTSLLVFVLMELLRRITERLEVPHLTSQVHARSKIHACLHAGA
jgi:hypothetical protein